MDRQAFQERFRERAACFRSSLEAMCASKSIGWQICTCDPELDETGLVTMTAKVLNQDEINSESGQLFDYCDFLMSQGFIVELVVEWSINHLKVMIASWEGEGEPDWDASIRSDFVLRWNGVTSPHDLGL